MPSQPNLPLPVTGAFALPFAAYYIVLSIRVAVQRIKHRVAIGDRIPPSPSPPPILSSATPSTSPPPPSPPPPKPAEEIHTTSDPLHLSTRAHQNFSEYIPLALTLSTIAELNGASPRLLKGILASLFVARVLHVEMGVLRPGALGWGRVGGFYWTLGVLGGLGGLGGGWLGARG
ncbi:membrane-associated, eicosanoid/glutathione metabolism protein [Annulohypoxylon maeteangense]|uniref:membrane-associated, eicosanoid/glutathione metabolism protein n=1 Tax=Annulohypoxylon maeteangense TaxID=1927788 RepID=UPI002008358A|nr:membrane-associated, eicosanoid/glutathione metabolism protein [Annulohypoxylon maeteangense]KAI0882798.1 membrane-associated, eicosanoid/glutathione metabolism protein [Annulohypoxylon maeteangense]